MLLPGWLYGPEMLLVFPCQSDICEVACPVSWPVEPVATGVTSSWSSHVSFHGPYTCERETTQLALEPVTLWLLCEYFTPSFHDGSVGLSHCWSSPVRVTSAKSLIPFPGLWDL